MHSDSMNFVICRHYGVYQAIAVASKNLKMCKQGFAGKRMNMTLMISNKREIIIRLGSGLKSMNHHMKEIPKWNTPLISCAVQIF